MNEISKDLAFFSEKQYAQKKYKYKSTFITKKKTILVEIKL